jgi:acyl transferase domain-containing protein/SAM-dependent methyltransferase/acyl carrier protein
VTAVDSAVDPAGAPAVAVVAASLRVPGASDPETFWRNLSDGVSSIRTFDDDELAAAGVPAGVRADPRYVPAGGVLDDVRSFDAGFFHLSPRDASLLDPQQRLLLECGWEALERAGHPSGEGVGIYAAVGFPQYLTTNLLPAGVLDADGRRHAAIWNDKDHASTRVAYELGLTGPAITVQTACSSSLVAVHQAVQSLLAGECDLALAGGCTLRLPERAGYLPVEGGPESPDGCCRAFDAAASGLVPGSGGAVVALRRFEDAVRDGNPVLARIRGSAVTNDGAAKVGYTAPGVDGQVRAIRTALAVAGVRPDDVGYVEAHGTGTRLGDPIEVAALTAAFGPGAGRAGPCLLGSVKTNVGHLDVGAGVVGLVKAVLAVWHGRVPPSLNFATANPDIDFASIPFEVATTLSGWPLHGPRYAGVSSFGIGGTNAHVVLDQTPEQEPGGAPDLGQDPTAAPAPQIIVLSARTAPALEAAVRRLAEDLAGDLAASRTDDPAGPRGLAEVAFTTQAGRRPFAHRTAVVATDLDGAVAALRAGPARHEAADSPAVAFLCPGQGALRAGAGARAYRAWPEFRRAVDECAELARPDLDADVRRVLLARPDDPDAVAATGHTAVAQPALFTLAYALGRQWQAWGVHPDTVLGHSLGEYVASCLAGVFDVADAVHLVVRRAALLQEIPAGAMLAVPLALDDLDDLDGAGLALAAQNGPRQSVVSGPAKAVEAYQRRLAGRRVASVRLASDRAFHSPMTEPVLDRFREVVGRVPRSAPRLTMVSGLTGGTLGDAEAADPGYWVRQLREPVRFTDAVGTLLDGGTPVCVELSGEPTLTRLVRRADRDAVAVAALGPVEGDPGEVAGGLAALGRVWAAAVKVDWQALHETRRRRVVLPTYPFQRSRHWVDAVSAPGPAGEEPGRHPLPAPAAVRRREDPGTWAAVPYWRPTGPVAAPPEREGAGWFVVAPRTPAASAVVDRLAAAEPVLARVASGTPYRRVLADLPRRPDRVLYWADPDAWVGAATAAGDGFVDLMRLAQELAADPTPCRIAVVTTRCQPVVPGEPVEPSAAPLLGIVRVLPQEGPHLSCVAIDLPADPGPADVDAAVVQLRHGPDAAGAGSSRTVAVRDGRGWHPDHAHVDLPPVTPGAGLREGGTYLLTGGLGSVGLTVAEHLARTCRANLVLTGRQVPDATAGRIGDLADWADDLAALDLDPPVRSERVVRAGRAVERLAAAYVARLLADAGVPLDAPTDPARVVTALGAVPGYRRFVRGMLSVLAEEGLVDLNETVRPRPDAPPPADPVALDAQVRAEYPEFAPVLDLLRRCVDATPAVLRGKRDPVEVLFPGGKSAGFDRVNRLIGEHSDQVHYLGVLRNAVRDLCGRAAAGDAPVRVLEIGAGKGRLTELLAPVLAEAGAEYVVTDVSAGFVTTLAERFAGPRTGFGTLDIARDPAAQGHEPGGFDLVVGFNVVHAAPDVVRAVAHLRDLLRPGGVLCLTEAVADERWGRLIWGLTREWWSFTDTGLRTRTPLLPVDDWTRVLSGAGLGAVGALPVTAERRAACDTTVLFAQRPHGSSLEPAAGPRAASLRRLAGLGTGVLARAVDVTDREAMCRLVEEAEERFGPIHGVFHLAYVAGGPLLELRTPEDVAAELAPKVDGTLVLDGIFRDRPLDFMLLFSSLTALTGGYGAAAYAGAGAFVDRFPAAVRRSYPVTSVSWPLWRGLDTPYANELRRRTHPENLDEVAMTPTEGLEVLGRLLAAAPGPHVVVSPVDVREVLDLAGRWRPADALRTEPAGIASTGDAAERRVMAIWQEVLGVDDVEPDADLTTLGGDSLVATQIVARLRDAFGVDVPLRDFFADPTPAGTVAAVRAARAGDTSLAYEDGAAAAGGAGDGPDLDDLLAEIEQLSDEQVRTELAADPPRTGEPS